MSIGPAAALPHVSTATSAARVAPSRTSTDLAGTGQVKVLITSNDSRIRIYNLADKSLDVKYKGHDNGCSQISATFSDDAKYVICGSEDRKAFIWNRQDAERFGENRDKQPCESFEAHGDMVTTALFAPTSTRMLLSGSGDPIYDLCNPPPVTLRSLGETTSTAASQTGQSNSDAETTVQRVSEKPAFVERSKHVDGNIIVTSDHAGIIKVFRQDCAFSKRKNDLWETGSSFSRRPTHGTSIGNGYIGGSVRRGRSGSLLTRHSNGSIATTGHSRRGSLSQPQPLPSSPGMGSPQMGSPQLSSSGAGPGGGGSSDRILSWRQGIVEGASGHAKRASSMKSSAGAGGHGGTPAPRSERSISPSKLGRSSLLSGDVEDVAEEPRSRDVSAATARPGVGVGGGGGGGEDGTTPSTSSLEGRRGGTAARKEGQGAATPPTPASTFRASGDEAGARVGPGVGAGAGDAQEQSPTGGYASFFNLSRLRGMVGLGGGQARGASSEVVVGGGAVDGGTAAAEAKDGGSAENRDRDRDRESRRRRGLGAATVLRRGGGEGDDQPPPLPRGGRLGHGDVARGQGQDRWRTMAPSGLSRELTNGSAGGGGGEEGGEEGMVIGLGIGEGGSAGEQGGRKAAGAVLLEGGRGEGRRKWGWRS